MAESEKKPYGPFGLPTTLVITAKPEHLERFKQEFDDVSFVDGQVEALITRRRLDTSRSDYDLTIIYELQSCELKGIPLEDWRIDWERSQFPVDPMERMIEKRLIEALSADD